MMKARNKICIHLHCILIDINRQCIHFMLESIIILCILLIINIIVFVCISSIWLRKQPGPIWCKLPDVSWVCSRCYTMLTKHIVFVIVYSMTVYGPVCHPKNITWYNILGLTDRSINCLIARSTMSYLFNNNNFMKIKACITLCMFVKQQLNYWPSWNM